MIFPQAPINRVGEVSFIKTHPLTHLFCVLFLASPFFTGFSYASEFCRSRQSEISLRLTDGDIHINTHWDNHLLKTAPFFFKSDHEVRVSDAKSSFFASNEYDYFRSPKRDPNDRSEIVLGFGSNGSWDIAARTGAEKMVLGDWSLGPLVMNENLFRPIFLISSTRAEFIANLAGVPNYSKAENLTSIFLNIRNRLSENPRGYPQRTEEIVNQLRALGDRRIGPQQINFIRRMQAALPPDNPDVSPNAYGKNSSLEEILFAFESRYASAALEESVHNGDPFFHFLASEEA